MRTATIRYTVGLIVDPNFGDRLTAWPTQMPVWIADTPSNHAAAEHARALRAAQALPAQELVTTFPVDSADSPADWAISVLDQIDLHHGAYSHDPPYSAIEVIGAAAEAGLIEALAEYGLTTITPQPNGFVASVGAVA